MTTEQAGEVLAFTRGDRLRKAREKMGLDQGPFAAVLGVSRGTVSAYERDEIERVKPIVMEMWALKTGVSLLWLETGEGSSHTPPGEPVMEGKTDRLAQLAASKRARHAGAPATRRYDQAA